MRKLIVGVVAALAALATSLYIQVGFLSYSFAILAFIFGAVVWTVGLVRHRDFRATVLAIVGIGTVQLLAIPIQDGIDRWEFEQWRSARPWNATLDSALAVRPAPDVPGTYDMVICPERCAPGDTANVFVVSELTLILDRSVVESYPERGVSPNGCLRFWDHSGPGGALHRLDEVSPIYWIQGRDGTVMWRDLERRSKGEWVYSFGTDTWSSIDAAVTSEGFVGIQSAGSALGGAERHWYVAGRRTGPPDAALCVLSETPS